MSRAGFILLVMLEVLLIANNAGATRRARIIVKNPDNFVSISQTLGKKEVACFLDKKGRLTPGVIKPRPQKTIWLNLKKRLRRLKRNRRLVINGKRKYRRLKRKIKLFRKACRDAKTPDGPWKPPIGIPEPQFGIHETYRIYDLPENRNPDLNYTENAEGGFYTHYIDNTHPSATDTGNPYGTAEQPRLTIPYTLTDGALPAGSVVEVHGGPYTYYIQTASGPTTAHPEGLLGGRRFPINGEGTSARPIFVRGINKPVLAPARGGVWIEGGYIIVENFEIHSGISLPPKTDFTDHVHHLAVRSSDFSGSGISMGWAHGGDSHPERRDPTLVNDIVIYNNTIHDIGVWNSETTNLDRAGVFPHINAKYIWIVDNHIYNVESDAIAVNCWGIYDDPAVHQPPMHIYIGRNDLHHNQENTIDVKVAFDVIVSQNKLHGIHKYVDNPEDPDGPKLELPGSDGTCVVGAHEDHGTDDFPYGERYWYIFNEIYDCDVGLRIQMSDNVYVIGNLIRDVHSSYPLLENNGYSSGGALQMWDIQTVHFVSNTVYNTDLGILLPDYGSNVQFNVVNNIIANLSDNHFSQFGSNGYHIYVKQSATAENSLLYNNVIYQKGEPAKIYWSGSGTDLPVYPSKDLWGNFRSNPLFLDPAGSNFNLGDGSPAIDSGTLSNVYQTFFNLYGIDLSKDRGGVSRPQDGEWDIGAYEYQ